MPSLASTGEHSLRDALLVKSISITSHFGLDQHESFHFLPSIHRHFRADPEESSITLGTLMCPMYAAP